jgi:hypothetical protein
VDYEPSATPPDPEECLDFAACGASGCAADADATRDDCIAACSGNKPKCMDDCEAAHAEAIDACFDDCLGCAEDQGCDKASTRCASAVGVSP